MRTSFASSAGALSAMAAKPRTTTDRSGNAATAAAGARGRPGRGLAGTHHLRGAGGGHPDSGRCRTRHAHDPDAAVQHLSGPGARIGAGRRRCPAWPGSAWLDGAAPFVLAALVAGVAVVLLQTRFLLSAKALRVDSRADQPAARPEAAIRRRSLIEAGKSLAKIAVLGDRSLAGAAGRSAGLMMAPFGDPRQLLARAARPCCTCCWWYWRRRRRSPGWTVFWVFLRHSRALRMSRQDIIEEQKETEGDPRIKARRGRSASLRARRRMLAAVPKATVVITNPTHYAVALVYDRAKHAAPRVVAKGVDTLAARIREVAEENRVPVVANPPLARALYPGGGRCRYSSRALPGGGGDHRLCLAAGTCAFRATSWARCCGGAVEPRCPRRRFGYGCLEGSASSSVERHPMDTLYGQRRGWPSIVSGKPASASA